MAGEWGGYNTKDEYYAALPTRRGVSDLSAYKTPQSRLDLLRSLGDKSYGAFDQASVNDPNAVNAHPLFSGDASGFGQLVRDPNGVYQRAPSWTNTGPGGTANIGAGGGGAQRFTPTPGGGGPPPRIIPEGTPGFHDIGAGETTGIPGVTPPQFDTRFRADTGVIGPPQMAPRQPGGGGPPVGPGGLFGERRPGGGAITPGVVAGGGDFMGRPGGGGTYPFAGGGVQGGPARTAGGPERGGGYVEPTFTGNASYNAATGNPLAGAQQAPRLGGGPPVGPGGVMPRQPGGGGPPVGPPATMIPRVSPGPPETGPGSYPGVNRVPGGGAVTPGMMPRTSPGPPETGAGSYPPPGVNRQPAGGGPPVGPPASPGAGVTVGAGETYTNPTYTKQLQPGGDQGYWPQQQGRPLNEQELRDVDAQQFRNMDELARTGFAGQPSWVGQSYQGKKARLAHRLFGG